MNYCNVYDKLYQHGYRPGDKWTGRAFFEAILPNFDFTTVLDVGCSYGRSVAIINGADKIGIGVEASRTAVDKGQSLGRAVFWGDATNLPFGDNMFDMVFSSDVIEHLKSNDGIAMLNEMYRVSREYMALQIACGKTKHRWKDVVPELDNVHMTLRKPDEWAMLLSCYGSIIYRGSSSKGKTVHLLVRKD